jgi:uncharacterized Zn finger protein
LIPGETLGYKAAGIQCTDCGENMELKVMKSGGGFYLGYGCSMCGPYTRETDYIKDRKSAQGLLEISHEAGMIIGRRR